MGADMRDSADPRVHYVYRLFNAENDLLYIGCTRDVDDRLMLHHATGGAVLCTTVQYPTKSAAREAERAAIKAESPLRNKQHNTTRFVGKPGGGFTPIEPIHPITAEMLHNEREVTMDDKREAMQKLADALGLGAA